MNINPNIEPMLCTECNFEKFEKDSIGLFRRFVAQEKLDGHRAIMLCHDGKNYFYCGPYVSSYSGGSGSLHFVGRRSKQKRTENGGVRICWKSSTDGFRI